MNATLDLQTLVILTLLRVLGHARKAGIKVDQRADRLNATERKAGKLLRSLSLRSLSLLRLLFCLQLLQATLEAEMTEAIGAEKGERTETRLSYRSGYYGRSLITRVGTLELRVPQDRLG
jgi:hypothetical protein